MFYVICILSFKEKKKERNNCWLAEKTLNPRNQTERPDPFPDPFSSSRTRTEQTRWPRKRRTLQLCDGACPAQNASTHSGSATVCLLSDRILWLFYIFDFALLHNQISPLLYLVAILNLFFSGQEKFQLDWHLIHPLDFLFFFFTHFAFQERWSLYL